MFRSSIYLEGGRELQEKLSELDRKVQRKIMSKAVRAGSRVVLKAAKQNAPKKTGLLRQSLKVRAGKRLRKGGVNFLVQTKDGDYKGETFYGAFVEYGHRLGKRKRGKMRRLIPGKEYMRRAFSQKRDMAAAVIADEVRRGIIANI